MAASLWLLHTAASSADQRTKLDARDRITTRPPLINKSKHETFVLAATSSMSPAKALHGTKNRALPLNEKIIP